MINQRCYGRDSEPREKQPWPSLEWASWIFDRASFVLIGSLVIGAAATIAMVWMGIVKEHQWDLAREKAGEKIAALDLETAKANARASEAQLALAKLKSPRMLDPSKFLDFWKEMEPFSGIQWDATIANEVEPSDFLRQFELVLSRAGWVQLDWKGNGQPIMTSG